MSEGAGHVLWFGDPACAEVAHAGGKGASLATMSASGFRVPPGFVVPSHVLDASVAAEELRARARARDHAGAVDLVRRTARVGDGILDAYEALGGRVAVRSSAVAEDSDVASYAGQQETFLNVEGREAVRDAVRECWASFFTERALFYRERMGSLDDLRMAVVVQRMVAAEKAGVVFTVHPVTRRRDRMLIEAVYGLGEQVVSGERTPDQYVVDRRGAPKRRSLAHGGVLTEEELRGLAELGGRLERHYGTPQDIEWAIHGDEIYLLQSRPVTTL